MKIFVTGDLHGEEGISRLSAKNWPVGRRLTKEDVVLVAGDFGLAFSGDKTENHWLDWLEEKQWTTLFIDGNHENFPLLLSYPEEERFSGPVGVLRPSVLHLRKRGHIYTIGLKSGVSEARPASIKTNVWKGGRGGPKRRRTRTRGSMRVRRFRVAGLSTLR